MHTLWVSSISSNVGIFPNVWSDFSRFISKVQILKDCLRLNQSHTKNGKLMLLYVNEDCHFRLISYHPVCLFIFLHSFLRKIEDILEQESVVRNIYK